MSFVPGRGATEWEERARIVCPGFGKERSEVEEGRLFLCIPVVRYERLRYLRSLLALFSSTRLPSLLEVRSANSVTLPAHFFLVLTLMLVFTSVSCITFGAPGNSGVGYETVLALIQHGARVYMASRSEQRAAEAIAKLRQKTANDESAGEVRFLKCDLGELASVRRAADEFLRCGFSSFFVVCRPTLEVAGRLTSDSCWLGSVRACAVETAKRQSFICFSTTLA